MVDSKYLLDDEAMQQFIMDGYIQLESSLPREIHHRIYSELGPLDEGGPRGHNNLLPCVPDLQLLLNEPIVVGALESLLGQNYYLHFHRHDHTNFPDSAQPLHKDGDNPTHLAVDRLRRHHPTRYVMLFYYPQDTPASAGPTGIVPGSQYVMRRKVESARKSYNDVFSHIPQQGREEIRTGKLDQTKASERAAELRNEILDQHPSLAQEAEEADAPWEASKIPLTGKAGAITIVHFDIVHGRYSKNTLKQPRHMVKFLFTRNEEPRRPTWRHVNQHWQPPNNQTQAPIWNFIWHWHLGKTLPAPTHGDHTDYVCHLDSDDDALAIAASYALARFDKGIDVLVNRFAESNIERRTIASYGLAAAGAKITPRLLEWLEPSTNTNDLLIRAVDLLGDIGPSAASALPKLLELVKHKDPRIRRYIAETIGILAERNTHLETPCIEALLQLITDEDALTTRNAVFSIARLGPLARTETIVNTLKKNIFHWHHHVRGWTVEALLRIEDPEATAFIIKYLNMSRWDPAPKSGDRPATHKPMRKNDP